MPPLLEFHNVDKVFRRSRGLLAGKSEIPAVDGVNLALHPGETLGLVGESGCGKSTLARMAVGLLEPSAGEIYFEGQSVYGGKGAARQARWRALRPKIQMVFQDPNASLNPRMAVGESVGEPLLCLGLEPDARKRRQKVAEMLERVGIGPDHLKRRPHEFSGGQRQRLAVARALIARPALVVCDEPTSSLDASVQAQVLNLLADLQDEFKPAYLFISHDLAVIRHMSDRTAVMYAGKIVEQAGGAELFARPLHPYSQLLVAAALGEGDEDEATAPTGPAAEGCAFAPRCPVRRPQCGLLPPQMRRLDGRRLVRCHSPRLGKG